MPYFQCSDFVSIFYLDDGPKAARPVVLIHGLTSDLHDWNWRVPFLLDLGYRIITPDLRGHGRSSAPNPSPGVRRWLGSGVETTVDYYPQTMAHNLITLL